jgi:glycosyltransferase involved in cell wall biosynthesis
MLMEKKFNYLTISSISKAKGIEDFVKIAELVKTKYPDDNFLWVGTGNISKNLKSNPNISFLNFPSDREKYRLLNKENTIFILCSHFEGFSMPIAEACLSETPVLTYKIPEIFHTYENYINYVHPFDIKEFVSKLLFIRKNYDKFKKKAIKSRIFVINNFSSYMFIKRMNSIIGDIFNGRLSKTNFQ